MKNDIKIQNLEEWLLKQPDKDFPPYYSDRGEKSYPDKYRDIKTALIPIHNNVEKGALLKSIADWKDSLKAQIAKIKDQTDLESIQEREQLNELLQRDPAVYLNYHGVGHVNKVIEKVSELVQNFRTGKLTAYETFLLLCAIQIHDIGNIFGRQNHENSLTHIFMNIANPIIHDTSIKVLITKIARVHSGRIDGDKDTISKSKLRFGGNSFGQEVRERLLAALLRFADELADDSSRADLQALDLGMISEESLIYHEYSRSLHTVKIKENDVNNTLFLLLEYCIDSELMIKRFIKEGKSKPILLLDEIFNRTIKMEQERRYCMRFFKQYLPLDEIKVRIEIVSTYDLVEPEEVNYTLKESGYPMNDNITIDCPINTGEKIIESLIDKGWRLSK